MTTKVAHLALSETESEIIARVGELIRAAAREFNKIPRDRQNEINGFHNEDGSLGHCLRWGDTACDELLACSEQPELEATAEQSRSA